MARGGDCSTMVGSPCWLPYESGDAGCGIWGIGERKFPLYGVCTGSGVPSGACEKKFGLEYSDGAVVPAERGYDRKSIP